MTTYHLCLSHVAAARQIGLPGDTVVILEPESPYCSECPMSEVKRGG